jgi:hypothetical protein
MERYTVVYGKEAYSILAESIDDAIFIAEDEYGEGWTKINVDDESFTPKQLAEEEGGWNFGGEEEEEEEGEEGEEEEEEIDESYFSRWDGDTDGRYDIVETLNHYRSEILIEDEDLFESLKKFSKFDDDGSIKELIENNIEGLAVRTGILADVFDLLFECQDRKLGNQKELAVLLDTLREGVNSGDYTYDFRTYVKSLKNERNYDPSGWKKFWTEEMGSSTMSSDGSGDMGDPNIQDPNADPNNPQDPNAIDLGNEDQKFVAVSPDGSMIWYDSIEDAEASGAEKIFPAKKAQ